MVTFKYPTIEEVNQATRLQICRWWRYLPSPGEQLIGRKGYDEAAQREGQVMDRISERFRELDGFTPAISKALGI